LLSDASFLDFALKIDVEFSEKASLKGCPACGGRLHYARYLRKGRLLEIDLPQEWNLFQGLCCANETCRKRVRPLSIRFAGRSPFNGSLVLLAKLLISGGSKRTIISLCKALKVSERTVRRWIHFWKYVHARSTWWRKLASIWSLSGKSLSELWNILLENKKSPKNSFEYLILNSAELWCEIKFSDGGDLPAKDA
jgi:hypothetical protein